MNSKYQKPNVLIVLSVLLVGAAASRAAVTYVDSANIIIPNTFEGVYLDLDAGTSSVPTGSSGEADLSGDSYTISYSQPDDASWDVNLFFGGAFVAHNETFQPYREDASEKLSAIHKVGLGELINGDPIDPGLSGVPSAPLTTPSFGASGTTTGGGLDGLPTPTHMGTGDAQFLSGSGTTGFIAFVLNPETTPQYGWMEVTLADDGTAGSIHRWAYSDDPIMVGVPEPGSLVLLALGSLALLRRKR